MSRLTTQPRSCDLTASRALATSVRLRDLRWSAWRRDSAVGHGIALPNHPGQGEKPRAVRVRLYRREASCDGHRYYVFSRASVGGYVHILDQPCDWRLHRIDFRDAVLRHVKARLGPTKYFQATEPIGCGIDGRPDGRGEYWRCAAEFSWSNPAHDCMRTFFGHFVDTEFFDKPIIDTPATCGPKA